MTSHSFLHAVIRLSLSSASISHLTSDLLTLSLQGGYTVKLVSELTLAAAQQRAAASFVQDRLYGPGSRRTTSRRTPL